MKKRLFFAGLLLLLALSSVLAIEPRLTQPNPKEWEKIEKILDAFFLLQESVSPDLQEELLIQLSRLLSGEFNILLLGTASPIGYLDLWDQHIYISAALFGPQMNAVYAKSIVRHEKIHEEQLALLGWTAIREDLRRRYGERLIEIAAHYGQLRYVLEQEDMEAVYLVLRNSLQQGVLPGILASFPEDDPVVAFLRETSPASQTLHEAGGKK